MRLDRLVSSSRCASPPPPLFPHHHIHPHTITHPSSLFVLEPFALQHIIQIVPSPKALLSLVWSTPLHNIECRFFLKIRLNCSGVFSLHLLMSASCLQIVAGLRKHVRRKDLMGKLVVTVLNLSAKIAGETSDGMILAAVTKGDQYEHGELVRPLSAPGMRLHLTTEPTSLSLRTIRMQHMQIVQGVTRQCLHC